MACEKHTGEILGVQVTQQSHSNAHGPTRFPSAMTSFMAIAADVTQPRQSANTATKIPPPAYPPNASGASRVGSIEGEDKGMPLQQESCEAS
jgi:hypothetical protein